MIRIILTLTLLTISNTIFSQIKEDPIMIKVKGGYLQGTITTPEEGSKTVVLIIPGTGPTDRDGNQPMFKTDSYKMLAEALAYNGVSSVRYDKRGVSASVNASNNNECILDVDVHLEDIYAWINLLNQRYQKIVLLGHSEGALVGILAASRNANINGVISIAGIGRTYDIVLKEQLKTLPNLNGPMREIAYDIVDSLSAGVYVDNIPFYLRNIFDAEIQPCLVSILKYDPQKIMKEVTIPVIIFHGDNDTQVSIADAYALAKANPKAKLRIIRNMNHVMKWCPSTDPDDQEESYINPIYPISDDLIKESITFIRAL